MKKILATLLALSCTCLQYVVACDVCKVKQPKVLQNITHGPGPQGNWDYVIIIIAAATVAATLMLSIKQLARPGEKAQDHIKHFIVEN